MSQTQEGQDLDVGEAEVGDSEDPDLIDGYEEETSEEPFDAEPSMEPPMEPPMEQVMEPEQTSPFENEFRTIDTKQPQQPQQPQQPEEEDEGVLFPDASETRAKKVGYY
jgi:hypothetical protein